MVKKHWEYSVLGSSPLYNLYSALKYVTRRGLPGSYVECGVFMGGSVMFAADTLIGLGDTSRQIYACDTFTGFVSRTDKDIDMEGRPVCHPSRGPSFRAVAEENIRSVPYPPERLAIIEGDVASTLPGLDESFCIVRLDTDTYETTLLELQVLYPRLVRGGLVIIDDYGWNQGARAAVEEYFSSEPNLVIRVDNYCRNLVKW